jgi:hypothetical protein
MQSAKLSPTGACSATALVFRRSFKPLATRPIEVHAMKPSVHITSVAPERVDERMCDEGPIVGSTARPAALVSLQARRAQLERDFEVEWKTRTSSSEFFTESNWRHAPDAHAPTPDPTPMLGRPHTNRRRVARPRAGYSAGSARVRRGGAVEAFLCALERGGAPKQSR